MAKLEVFAGTTSKIVRVFISDSSKIDGSGLAGLTYASSSLTAYYAKEGAGSATAIVLVTASLGVWSSGGFVEFDATNMPGWYELGLPNAAISTSGYVNVHLKGATNMVPVPIEIELTATNNQTAVPDVNASKLGGTTQTGRDIGASVLLSSGTGTGQLDFTSGVVKGNITQADGAALTTHASGKIPADVLNVGGVAQTGRDIGASVLLSSGTGTGQVLLSSGLVAVDNSASGLKRNAAFTSLPFVMRSDTTKLPVPGLTVTVKRMLDAGGSFVTGGLNNVIDAGNGAYTVDGIAGDSDGKYVSFLATATGADPTMFTLISVP